MSEVRADQWKCSAHHHTVPVDIRVTVLRGTDHVTHRMYTTHKRVHYKNRPTYFSQQATFHCLVSIAR